MKERVWKTIVCVILCVTVLSLSVSVFADDPTPEPTSTIPPIEEMNNILWDESGAYLTWAYLASMGIVIADDPTNMQYTNEIQNQLTTWVIEFLEQLPSPLSIYTWVRPWLWSEDFWGNVRMNSSMLEDIEDFADWLITKFNLTDNSTIVVNPNYSVDGYSFYSFDTYYPVVTAITGEPSTYYQSIKVDETSTNNFSPIGFTVVYSEFQETRMIVYGRVTGTNPTFAFRYVLLEYDNWEWQSPAPPHSNVISSWVNNDNGYQTGAMGYWPHSGNQDQDLVPKDANFYTAVDINDYNQFMEESEIVSTGSTQIVVYTINLPSDDLDYTPGDSVTIVDGKPEYSDIEWDGTVTVSNLPAVVSTGTVSNPQLIEVWRPISSVLEYSADAMAAIIGIMYELPEEVIIPIYAVMGSVIILGVIKLMREH